MNPSEPRIAVPAQALTGEPAGRPDDRPAMPAATTRLLSIGSVEMLEIGDGPHLVVLLHAAAQSLRAMTPLARRLARPDRRVLVPHLALDRAPDRAPDRAAGEGPIAAYADIALACLAEVPAERRLLFGHSMGALAALVAAARGARRDCLVLYEPIVTAQLDQGDPGDLALRQWDARIVERMEAELAAGDPEAAVARFIEAWNEVRWDTLPVPARERLAADAAGLARLVRATTDFDAGPDLVGAVAGPAFVLQGTESPAITQRMSERLAAALAGARLRMLPGCGHMGPVLQSGGVATALEAILGSPD